MSFLATIRCSPIAGANITYTFPTSIDTTTLQPGQAFDVRSYLFSIGVIKNYNISTRLNLIIPSGVTLRSTDATKPVLTIANFKSRDTITIINQGNILGAGGPGGAGGYQTGGSPGLVGGNAIVLSSGKCFIDNSSGVIGSGSGGNGGAGGINTYISQSCCSSYFCGRCTQWAGFKTWGFNTCDGDGGTCDGNPGCGGGRGCEWKWNFCFRTNDYCCNWYNCSYWTYATGAAGIAGSIGGGIAGTSGAANSYTGGAGGAAGLSIRGTNFLFNVPGGTIRGNTSPT